MFDRVLALETDDGDFNVCYASPGVQVAIGDGIIVAVDSNGNQIGVDSFFESMLRNTNTLQDFWQEVHILRNTDVRLGLIGG